MDCAPDIATSLESWLRLYGAVAPASTFREISPPADPSVTVPALAALAAEALARNRTLRIITADDAWLPDLSNALDLRLRPLCLVLPGAQYAGRIALRATLSLLKSRLARDSDDSEGPAWAAMRARLQDDNTLWRECLAWSKRGLDREPAPEDIASLFPIRIGPCTPTEPLTADADWVMLVQAGQLPQTWKTAWPGARQTLMLASGVISGTTTLVVIDEAARLRAEIEVIGQELAEMELELATAQGELAEFSTLYHETIAWRIAELDQLQAGLAKIRMQQTPDDPALDAAAKQAQARAEHSKRDNENYKSSHAQSEGRFSPSTDLKKRFRQLAQKIHPDRAQDEADRAWRTQLMSEANRAYRVGDVIALDEVLTLWLEGQQHQGTERSAVPGSSVSATSALEAQLTRIQERLAAIAAELDRLYGSRLYELHAAARVARRQGRDLLQEMADRIDLQIDAAQAALDSFSTSKEAIAA